MAEERRCGQCGKGLPADAPGGLCPECLLNMGLQSQSQEPPDQGAEGVLPTVSYRRDSDGAAKEDKGDAVALAPGQQFGGYRVVRRLGRLFRDTCVSHREPEESSLIGVPMQTDGSPRGF